MSRRFLMPAVGWPTKHVRLRLEAGGYGATLDVHAVSDTLETGWYAIENAICEAYSRLPSRLAPADPHHPAAGTVTIRYLELADAGGNPRTVEDTDLRGEEWLKDFVVAAEII